MSLIPVIGIMASYDPVAIDQASLDLVNSMPGYNPKEDGTIEYIPPGQDKLSILYPETPWWIIFEEPERLGVGQRRYKLIKL